MDQHWKPRNQNSIRSAAAVALFDSRGNILLLRRKDNDKWTRPGGTFDFGESLTDCTMREVIAGSDGEVQQEFNLFMPPRSDPGS
jgi:ADP-ribose pyrophosphatase YjhB (NUDIX family)